MRRAFCILAWIARFGTLLTPLINFVALDQTDEKLIERECGECGLDWKEVWLLCEEKDHPTSPG